MQVINATSLVDLQPAVYTAFGVTGCSSSASEEQLDGVYGGDVSALVSIYSSDIQQVQALLASLAQGVSAASLVTILAGLLVLAGAIAAGTRARLYEATILKVLGATRARIALVYAIEYGVLGLATGVIALLAGTLAGWVIAFAILDVPFTFDAQAVLITVVGGAAATLLFGLLGALGALSVRPAQRLRSS